MTALARLGGLRSRFGLGRSLAPGMSAILVKELRGRMRGRRTYVILTLYLLLLSGFSWMLAQQSTSSMNMGGCFDSRFGGFCGQNALYLSPTIGRGIFVGLVILLTIVVTLLSPAFTASAISGEREHQTLDLLAATPISSLAIVLGKLISSLAWIFLLIVAAVPVTALVFVFGGVGPEDLVRAYLVLFATAIGLGSVGLFFSALVRRSVAATGLTTIATVAIMGGTIFVWGFLTITGGYDATGNRTRQPEQLLYLNSFVAQADIACDASGGTDGLCSVMWTILGQDNVIQAQPMPMPAPDVKGGANWIAADAPMVIGKEQAVVPTRDRFWPKTVISWLVLAAVLTTLSVQSVTSTRRLRLRLPRIRRPFRRAAA